jgi:SAM-dependent methyltransferase
MLSVMDRYRLANRALWNEWTAINVRAETFYRLEEFRAGGVRVRDYEIEEVGPVTGKDLLHLQCHFGTDTLSWARLGARVTGADFSETAIGRARSLAAELGIAATFVCAELYELPERLDGDFDVVYTSRGVLGWLPDIPRWAGVVARFLRPGGIFYITEVHPVALAFDDRSGVTDPAPLPVLEPAGADRHPDPGFVR